MKRLYCIIGPSGSGKSTYVHDAVKNMGYGEIISTTTRLPRQNERDGIDYHFVSEDVFFSLNMVQRDEYAHHYYGTAQKDIDNAFKNSSYAFMVVTYEGAIDFKKIFKERELDIEVITIFIYTPLDILKERMIKRGDDYEKIMQRINNIENRKEYDNKEKTDYVFEVDTSLSIDESCFQFRQFIESLNQK